MANERPDLYELLTMRSLIVETIELTVELMLDETDPIELRKLGDDEIKLQRMLDEVTQQIARAIDFSNHEHF